MYANFRRLLVIYRGSRGPFVISQVFLAISVLLSLAIVALNGTLVNDGVQQGNIRVVISTAAWMIGLTLIQTVFSLGNTLFAVLFAEGTANILRTATYRKVQSLSFGNLDRFRTSDLLVRLTSDVNNVKLAVLYAVLLLFQAPFMVVMAIIMAFIMLPNLLWLMLLIMVVVATVLLVLLRGVQQMFLARQEALDGVNNVLQEALAGVRVVKAFVRERFESQRFARATDTWFDAALRPAYRLALFVPTMQMLLYIGTAALYYFGGRGVLAGDTDLGEIVVFSNVLSLVIVPMALLAFILPYLEAGEASTGRLLELIDEQPEIADPKTPQPLAPTGARGRIVFVILDDSTSALDMATEARVQEEVQALMADSTKLYVAQRISTVLTADQIVLLDGGRQVAVGTHAELIGSSPLYREIYESQLGKLEDQPDGVAAPPFAPLPTAGGAA